MTQIIPIQTLGQAPAPPAGDGFSDEEYLSAAGKRQIRQDWQRFISGGFKKLFFTRDLYRFLQHQCGFTAHHNQDTFWAYYFNAEVIRLRLFLNQFGGNGRSVEFGAMAWLGGPATDLKQAMCHDMGQLYAPLLQVLEDLELKHAELGRVWRDFALRTSPLRESQDAALQQAQDAAQTSGIPDPGFPPHYLASENTRNLLAYAAQIVLDHPRPLLALQQQFPLPFLQQAGLYVAKAA